MMSGSLLFIIVVIEVNALRLLLASGVVSLVLVVQLFNLVAVELLLVAVPVFFESLLQGASSQVLNVTVAFFPILIMVLFVVGRHVFD
jgi:hypothetical protein